MLIHKSVCMFPRNTFRRAEVMDQNILNIFKSFEKYGKNPKSHSDLYTTENKK